MGLRCFRSVAEGWPVTVSYWYGLPDLCAGRLENTDRGPTVAFVVVVGRDHRQARNRRPVFCTIMAGVLLVVLGVTAMGAMVKYFPAALHRRLHQTAIAIPHRQHCILADFFVEMESRPRLFLSRMMAFGQRGILFQYRSAVSILSIATMVIV